jgi:hypothetical protein
MEFRRSSYRLCRERIDDGGRNGQRSDAIKPRNQKAETDRVKKERRSFYDDRIVIRGFALH